jgi:hypothetical protein
MRNKRYQSLKGKDEGDDRIVKERRTRERNPTNSKSKETTLGKDNEEDHFLWTIL